ncbi:hypothetical protein [Actinosynnema sp. NPDC020468]|uniref:hypothetical protein n=1 Tax=Actinosynnema sp. NPDC020468 TaxID=3154488 RepID=UPI0033F1EF8D
MGILLLKLLLAPSLVVASTLAGRRWGPEVAGILVGLPIVAGPILFITYRLHGAEFAAGAAASSLFGLVSLAVFVVVFSRVAAWRGWFATSVVGWGVVLAVDFALSGVRVTTAVAVGCTLVATAVALVAMPRVPTTSDVVAVASRWDLPGRAVVTGVLVLVVTTASSALGPRWTGLVAPLPIATGVVAAFALARHGHVVTARTLGGVLVGLFGFAGFCLAVAVLVRPLGGVSFLVGGAVAVAVQLVVARVVAGVRGRGCEDST